MPGGHFSLSVQKEPLCKEVAKQKESGRRDEKCPTSFFRALMPEVEKYTCTTNHSSQSDFYLSLAVKNPNTTL